MGSKLYREINVEQLPFELASYNFMGRFCPAVTTNSIRILKGSSHSLGGNTTTTYDYFKLNSDGVIIQSPRGYAKEYNKKVKIINMEEAIKKYDKPVQY